MPAANPKTISMLGLADEFQRVHEQQTNRNFCFILGAGASISSGIKSASAMVQDWIGLIHRAETGSDKPVPKEWITAKNLGIEAFDPKDPAAAYSDLYRRMYEDDPDKGYAYLEKQMENADPSFGYSILGGILGETRHKVVITVNFDNLVADSVGLFSKTYPLVCGHELLTSFVSDTLRRPLVLKVHRDLLLHPQSLKDEIGRIDSGMCAAVKRLLARYTPIVIGYGGNDGSLMSCLEQLDENSVPGGIYWCYRAGGVAPSDRIKAIVARQRGRMVEILGFDELMMLLGNALKLGPPDEPLLKRAKERADRIGRHAVELSQRLAEQREKLAAGGYEWTGGGNTQPVEAVEQALSATAARRTGTKTWGDWEMEARRETDPKKRDRIYQDAVTALPNSAELLNNYAYFLTNIRKEHDQAQALYERAIANNPNHSYSLGGYAVFLKDIRKEHDKAQALYERAIAADPNHAINLGNYALFLTNIRKDHDKAQAMYERAIAADPNHAIHLGGYAVFLKNIRSENDKAQELYERAIAADPRNVTNLGNYALFLKSIRKDLPKAREMYDRAVAADPIAAAYFSESFDTR